MANQDLYNKLREAYSDESLNSITSKIIELYKNKQHASLRKIFDALEMEHQGNSLSKNFSKLIFLYHPDKGHQYRDEIEKAYHSGNHKQLETYAHIFIIRDIDNITIEIDDDIDIDYHPEYVWDYDEVQNQYADEFDYVSENPEDGFEDYDYTFFSALKRRLYGTLDVDLPGYYLDDLDEVEMASSDIKDLAGIENCRQTVFLNLSCNGISDLTEIGRLPLIEELYLGENDIGYIDPLSNLLKLRVVDLSNNYIDDISPLFNLPDLEYVNLTGNKVPFEQIDYLKQNDVIVVV